MRELIAQICLENHDQDKHFNFACEGVATAVVTHIPHAIHNVGRRVYGLIEGIKKKKQHLNDIADSTIEWLKDEDKNNKNLDLDMGSFKTFFKTSEKKSYRYYYLFNDTIYNGIVQALKKDESTELEQFVDQIVNLVSGMKTLNSVDMKDRKSATRLLDNIRTIKDLIILVDKYRARANIIFDLLEKRDRPVKGFPYQMLLAGVSDLAQTCKKIVNLAT